MQPGSNAMTGSKISRSFLATNQNAKNKAGKLLEISSGFPLSRDCFNGPKGNA